MRSHTNVTPRHLRQSNRTPLWSASEVSLPSVYICPQQQRSAGGETVRKRPETEPRVTPCNPTSPSVSRCRPPKTWRGCRPQLNLLKGVQNGAATTAFFATKQKQVESGDTIAPTIMPCNLMEHRRSAHTTARNVLNRDQIVVMDGAQSPAIV